MKSFLSFNFYCSSSLWILCLEFFLQNATLFKCSHRRGNRTTLMVNPILSRDSLRKQARHLEYQIDSRLITFSQSTTSSTPNTSTQQELSTLLQNLTKVTQDMGVWVQQNPSYSHLHSRHLSNLYEYNKEFAKTRVLDINIGEYQVGAGTFRVTLWINVLWSWTKWICEDGNFTWNGWWNTAVLIANLGGH